jgi:hypothetical protein
VAHDRSYPYYDQTLGTLPRRTHRIMSRALRRRLRSPAVASALMAMRRLSSARSSVRGGMRAFAIIARPSASPDRDPRVGFSNTL